MVSQAGIRLLIESAQPPLVVATRVPRFSWQVPFDGRGRSQSAYQVLVATTRERLCPGQADLWDSGKVESAQSVNVVYAGTRLESNRDCWCGVQVWDERGEPSGWSEPVLFCTPLFDESDWSAQWIGMGDANEPFADPATFQQQRVAPEVAEFEPDARSPLLRKSFAIEKRVRRARVFVCGLGLGELRLNGAKVGSDVLSTPRTAFREKVIYSTYDVTSMLTSGTNTVGLILGNGWFNGLKKWWGWRTQWHGSPRAIVQMQIEFEDGSTARVVSDESWRGSWSPITLNCIYDGEDYDARLEQDGWDAPGFDDEAWTQANVVAAPGGKLVPISHEPGRVVERHAPVAMSEPEPGVFVFDMGRNMTGWVRLVMKGGKPGEVVKLRFAEAVDEKGRLNPRSNNAARQADHYTLRGSGNESFEPRFTYHGFQYVEVTGYPGTPGLDTIEACFVRMAVNQIGSFECGHELINKIHRCTVQSQLCNLQMGVPTDDTQRPERLGWAGDAWSFAEEAHYNLDVSRVFAKWIADFYDQQDETGMVGMIVPQAGPEEDLVWSAAFVLMPWWQYVHCGDRRILEESYPYLQRYLTYLARTGLKKVEPRSPDATLKALRWFCAKEQRYSSEADRGHLQISQWGDHLAINEGSSGARKNQPLSIATAFYFQDVATMARIAEALGKTEDAARYRALAEQIKDAFNERFLEESWGYYDTGCQSAQAWPLAFGMVPETQRESVLGYFTGSVGQRQGHLTTGYAGTKWAIRAMGEAGRHDIIWKLAIAEHYPSWGYMLRDPKRSTITENWMGGGSLCHTTLGAAIDEWFYWGLAGIRPDASAPGYERIIIKPYIPMGLPWARASLRTLRGRIVSQWQHEGGAASLRISIPANSTARVYLPADTSTPIMEGDVAASEADGVKSLGAEDGARVFEVGSGAYCFQFTLAASAAQV